VNPLQAELLSKSVAGSIESSLVELVEQDLWNWIHKFVTAPSEFYDGHFAPCPYARGAVNNNTVDVRAWHSGDVREFIRDNAIGMRDTPKLTTRAMAFPPRMQFKWGLSDYVESLNAELIADNVFLNTGIARNTRSRYPQPPCTDPYFIVIANSLAAVLEGCEALKKTDYYKDWPAAHYALVVERRERMAERYGKK
jgi:hypothetical protein